MPSLLGQGRAELEAQPGKIDSGFLRVQAQAVGRVGLRKESGTVGEGVKQSELALKP
jgi:hypothetical protein